MLCRFAEKPRLLVKIDTIIYKNTHFDSRQSIDNDTKMSLIQR